MTFDDLLDRLWGFDFEVTAFDWLLVCKKYRTHERVVFHNCPRNDIDQWLKKEKPILMGYNTKGYDQYILRGILSGLEPREVKQVNDYIINGGNGWEFDYPEMVEMPTIWDLMQQIKTFKSLKECEGNLGLSIVESSVDFSINHKWTKEEYDEMLFYCDCDVEALFPIFEFQMDAYKSKFVIAKLGKMDEEKTLGMTDANITAALLGAKRIEHDDNFAYTYPSVIDKSKIPKEVLDYIDDLIEHNDLNYKPKAPTLQIDDCVIQLGVGGIHGAKETTFIYDEGITFKCE